MKLGRVHHGAPESLSLCTSVWIGEFGASGSLDLERVTCRRCLARAAARGIVSVPAAAPLVAPVVQPLDVVAPQHAAAAVLHVEQVAPAPATMAEAAGTPPARKIGPSGYRGVSWTASTGRWRAMVAVGKKLVYAGVYLTPEDAARAYDAKALELKGPHAGLNFESSRTAPSPVPAPAHRPRVPAAPPRGPAKPPAPAPAPAPAPPADAAAQRLRGRLRKAPAPPTFEQAPPPKAAPIPAERTTRLLLPPPPGAPMPKIRGEEQNALVLRAQAGDTKARDLLIHSNDAFVLFIARPFFKHGDAEDILQEGRMGLLRALETFEPARGNALTTYAFHWIRQHITRFLDDTRGVARVPVGTAYKMRKAHRLGITLAEAGMAERTIAALQHFDFRGVSFDLPIGEDGDTTFGDRMASTTPSPEAEAAETDVQAARTQVIEAAMKAVLSPRQREVFRRRVLAEDPETLDVIGTSLGGLSRERIRQIEAKALHRVTAALARDQRKGLLRELPEVLGPAREVLVLEATPAGSFLEAELGEGDDALAASASRSPSTALPAQFGPRRGRVNKSGFLGVTRVKHIDRWQAIVSHQGKPHFIGTWSTPGTAAHGYDEAAIRFKGPLAELNFPDDRERLIALVASTPTPPVRAPRELTCSKCLASGHNARSCRDVAKAPPPVPPPPAAPPPALSPVLVVPKPVVRVHAPDGAAGGPKTLAPVAAPAAALAVVVAAPATWSGATPAEAIGQLLYEASRCCVGVARGASRALARALAQYGSAGGVVAMLETVRAHATQLRRETWTFEPGHLESRLSTLVLWTVLRRALSILRKAKRERAEPQAPVGTAGWMRLTALPMKPPRRAVLEEV